MPTFKSNEVMIISGRRGFGKSTHAKHIARASPKLIIWDPMFEYGKFGTVVRRVKDGENLDRIVVQTSNNTTKEFEEFCKYIWYNKKNVIVIIDELDEHAKHTILPPYCGKLFRLGRHKGIGCVGIARRIAMLHKTPPAQAHHIVSFNQSLPNDVEYLAEFIGKERAIKLRTLPKFTYLWVNTETDVVEIGKVSKL